MTPFARHLHDLIAHEGPITVERYMSLCLRHYYATRDPLGAAGDFTTAPEISQMFGELLGLWCAAVWQAMGSPDRFSFVELGPGRGTLMADALRAVRRVPGFLEAARVHLVETSPALRARQEAALAGAGVPLAWHDDLSDVPAGPVVAVANEFFDALPVRQFIATERGWCERLVAANDTGFLFGARAEPEAGFGPPGRVGEVAEIAEAGLALAGGLAERLARDGGAALLVDYGYEGRQTASTLQAVKNHAPADPLAEPGEADLTSHVPFSQLAAAARRRGASVHGPAPQGTFLKALGIETRAAALKARATPEQAAAVDAALARLTGPDPGMGDLFKAMALSHPGLSALPGFEPPPENAA